MKQFRLIASVIMVLSLSLYQGCSSHEAQCTKQSDVKYFTLVPQFNSTVKLDTVKAGKFDTGRMWTFDYPPKDYFESEYNFSPGDDWFDNVRMSALRFANYCSASFVSADGLVMTNHHCARESVTEVEQPGENLHELGFFAKTMADERKVPSLYVDQLVKIIDVTSDIQKAIDASASDAEKTKNRDTKKKEIEAKYKGETGFEASVVTFYNGGKYSLYLYKRYHDVRLVFAPETQMGFFGGDPDNFTYPRYALDCSFFRVYGDDGQPLKTKNFYKWSPNGALPGEPIFVVGNPGSTNRLRPVVNLEYSRDLYYPYILNYLQGMVDMYTEEVKAAKPEEKGAKEDDLFGVSNSLKAYTGIQQGLEDPILMQKKRDFESKFKAAVMARPDLAKKYGDLWDKIAGTRGELRQIFKYNVGYNLNPNNTSAYFTIAKELIDYAKAMKLPESEREEKYLGEELLKTQQALFPADFDAFKSKLRLQLNLRTLTFVLGQDNEFVQNLTGGKPLTAAVDYCLSISKITNASDVAALVKAGPDAILNSNDPFIQFMLTAPDKGKEYQQKAQEISKREGAYTEALGRALFEVYGTQIPPDATFTLRISDGIVDGYSYNGTLAPAMTTFYGLYDRYYSNDKKFPWNLPTRWEHPPANFDLETPMVFVSTADIIGGNSGSPVINEKAEIVGLAFDGNIESLPGQFIFTTEANRTVSVHSSGMLEAIQDMYLAKRLSDELRAGKIVP